jgi:hypothetical protein
MDPVNLGIIVTVFILTFILGKNDGNSYTYYGELLLPFLVFLVMPKIEELFKTSMHQFLVQGLLLVFCVFPFRLTYDTDFTAYKNTFSNIYQYADQCTNIYDKTPLLALYKIDHGYLPIYNNGFVEYAPFSIPDKQTLAGKLSSVPTDKFEMQVLRWEQDISNRLTGKGFDCIFTDKKEKFTGYRQVGKIENVLNYWTVYVWVVTKT